MTKVIKAGIQMPMSNVGLKSLLSRQAFVTQAVCSGWRPPLRLKSLLSRQAFVTYRNELSGKKERAD